MTLRIAHLINARGSKRTQLVPDTAQLRESYERTGETWKVVRVDPVALDVETTDMDGLRAHVERAGGNR